MPGELESPWHRLVVRRPRCAFQRGGAFAEASRKGRHVRMDSGGCPGGESVLGKGQKAAALEGAWGRLQRPPVACCWPGASLGLPALVSPDVRGGGVSNRERVTFYATPALLPAPPGRPAFAHAVPFTTPALSPGSDRTQVRPTLVSFSAACCLLASQPLPWAGGPLKVPVTSWGLGCL